MGASDTEKQGRHRGQDSGREPKKVPQTTPAPGPRAQPCLRWRCWWQCVCPAEGQLCGSYSWLSDPHAWVPNPPPETLLEILFCFSWPGLGPAPELWGQRRQSWPWAHRGRHARGSPEPARPTHRRQSPGDGQGTRISCTESGDEARREMTGNWGCSAPGKRTRGLFCTPAWGERDAHSPAIFQ